MSIINDYAQRLLIIERKDRNINEKDDLINNFATELESLKFSRNILSKMIEELNTIYNTDFKFDNFMDGLKRQNRREVTFNGGYNNKLLKPATHNLIETKDEFPSTLYQPHTMSWNEAKPKQSKYSTQNSERKDS